MILMQEDWHRDTLQWSWICGRGMAAVVAFTKRPLRNPTSGFLSRKAREGREREKEREGYISYVRQRQGELYGEPRSVITSLRVESTDDRCRPLSWRKAVARVSERINQVRGALQLKISNVSYELAVVITLLMDLLRFLRKPAVPLFL